MARPVDAFEVWQWFLEGYLKKPLFGMVKTKNADSGKWRLARMA